ncbi:PKD domain-containing protein [Dokdonella sp.]|uniref:PKD domain-containing protein n=1 Tax=Dokdonella sp. TaxID=2291710 RepID=UPI001B06312B|nr:PKD domain-containing protein [Dokdonella sp.]MBO9663038.1 PKD domain-containing protein [Dokdonella sp.]
MSHSVLRRLGRFVLAASPLLAMLPATAVEREKGENPREESWQIEQRQRWFEQTRGLRQVPDAARLRANASKELQRQRSITQARHIAGGEVWQELGPSSMDMVDWIMGRVAGRLNAITPHPTDDDTVYIAAAAGGVWKTTNGGTDWTPLFDEVGTLPAGAVTLDPSNPDVVWVGTGDKNGGGCAGYFGQGVYLSEDGGASWNARNGSGTGAMPLSVVNAVAIQPTDGNVILAGGAGSCDANGSMINPGVYRSADRGLTWTQVLDKNVEDIVFVPGTATVYAGLIGQGVFKSTDGGATWASSGTGLVATGSRMRLAIAPSDSNVLYALVGRSNGSRVFRSGDGGATWTQRNTAVCEGQCTYNQTLAVHPTDPDTILVGTIRAARSTDGGATFTPLTDTWGTNQSVHQDTHVVRYSRNDPDRFWVGSDGGIWRSDDDGASFRNMNANLNITQFYDIAVHPSDPNIVLGGAQDNGSSGRRTSLLWDLTFASGDGFMNAFDQINPLIVFQTSYPSGGYPSIVRSTQGGSNGSYSGMSNAGLVAGNFPWVTPLATAGDQLFVASDVLYRTLTTGNTWTAISPGMGSPASVITPQLHGSMTPTYVGTSGGRIYASPDAGVPSPVFTNVTGNYAGGYVSDIAIDPVDPQRVFLTREGFNASRLYRSTTGGTTWDAVGAGLPNVPANSVAIDPLDTDRIFVATDIGVYESVDGGDNFAAFSTGMPLGVVVQDLEIDDDPHVLTAGTYARGAWRVVLGGSSTNLPPTADFTASVADLDASFTDRSIDDGSIVSHQWDFGDGSAASSDVNPTHTYASYGRYTVSLTVTDDGGLSGTYAKIVRFPLPPIPLSNGVTLTAQHAPQGDDLYYTLVVPDGATNLNFVVDGAAGEDADLVVKLGDQVICQSAGPTADESCGTPSPQAGTYTAIVNAYSDLSDFSITGSYDAPDTDTIFADGFDGGAAR